MRPKSQPFVRRGLAVLAAAALVGALGWALWPKPVPVELAEVGKGPLVVTVDEEGKTRIKDVYAVSAPITGKLVRLALEAGDRVKKDVTVVAVIEPMAPPFLDVRSTRELEAQIEAAKAAVALAEAEVNQAAAELEFAESELKRAAALIGTKAISERAMERAKIDADTRRAALARTRSNLEVRKRELESGQARMLGPEEQWKGEVAVGCCVNVRAPANGRVLRLIQESERVVVAGTPVVEIGDPSDLEIVVELLSVDAVKVREGATAIVDGWGGQPLTAKVTRVEPAGFTKVSALGIEEQRVRTILRLQAAGQGGGQSGEHGADHLGHDFRVFVRIKVYEAPDALRVPISALFRKRDQWTVYVVERGRARAAPVRIGQRNTAFAEVLGGLSEGAVVVLHPSDRVADGVRVTRTNEER
jgi:HlyD family secretion protein